MAGVLPLKKAGGGLGGAGAGAGEAGFRVRPTLTANELFGLIHFGLSNTLNGEKSISN